MARTNPAPVSPRESMATRPPNGLAFRCFGGVPGSGVRFGGRRGSRLARGPRAWGEIAGLPGLAGAGSPGAVTDEEWRVEDLQQEGGQRQVKLVRGEKPP